MKKFISALALVALLIGSFLWYSGWKAKQKQSANLASLSGQKNALDQPGGDNGDVNISAIDEMEQEEADFNAMCEKGEWQKIDEGVSGTDNVKGRLLIDYPDVDAENGNSSFSYWIGGEEKISIKGDSAVLEKLDFFENREVEAKGKINAGAVKEMMISEIRCGGQETDASAIGEREKLLDWLAENVNSIATQKAPYQKWQANAAYFMDQNNVYLEFYDSIEDTDDFDLEVDTTRQVLVEVKPKASGGYEAKVLAYWEMGDEDFELKSGKDKFEEQDPLYEYGYDPEDQTWTRN